MHSHLPSTVSDVMTTIHDPVMVDEVLLHLRPQRGGVFVDCTVGTGGHARRLLEAGASRLIGIDRDSEALEIAANQLGHLTDRAELIHANFRDLSQLLDERGITHIDGALADFGLSSLQLEAPGRGFSFRRDEPLDMRMDRTSGSTAANLLAQESEVSLANLIYEFGEERYARRVARAIVRAREVAPVRTTGELAAIIRRAIPSRGRRWRIDPATRTFQALRIWLNQELDQLDAFISTVGRRLRIGARFVIISFHSLEDRIVKHTVRGLAKTGEVALRVLTRKPIVPSEAEVARNPRARSAKLRVVEGHV